MVRGSESFTEAREGDFRDQQGSGMTGEGLIISRSETFMLGKFSFELWFKRYFKFLKIVI